MIITNLIDELVITNNIKFVGLKTELEVKSFWPLFRSIEFVAGNAILTANLAFHFHLCLSF